MDRQEAIEILEEVKVLDDSMYQFNPKYMKSLDMAIEALQTEQLKESQENFNKHSETESMLNADLISRQALLSKIEAVCFSKRWSEFRVNYGSNGTRDYIINHIKQMPSVQPEQKVGKWSIAWKPYTPDSAVYVCSECKCGIQYVAPNWNYCPICGAKMEEGE